MLLPNKDWDDWDDEPEPLIDVGISESTKEKKTTGKHYFKTWEDKLY